MKILARLFDFVDGLMTAPRSGSGSMPYVPTAGYEERQKQKRLERMQRSSRQPVWLDDDGKVHTGSREE